MARRAGFAVRGVSPVVAAARDARRRAVLALAVLAAVVVAAAPAAWAAFRPTASATMRIGTSSVTAPTSLTYTMQCPTGGDKRAIATVTGFSTVPNAKGYVLRLTGDSGSVSATVTAPGTTVLTLQNQPGARAFTVSVSTLMGTWTSTPFSSAFQC